MGPLKWSKKKPESLWNAKREYVHCTKSLDTLTKILQSGQIKFAQKGLFAGAFVANIPETIYGEYCLVMSNNIEKIPVLRTACFNNNLCYVGFAKNIPVNNSTLVGITVPSYVGPDNLVQLREILKSAGMKDVPIHDTRYIQDIMISNTRANGTVLPANWNTTNDLSYAYTTDVPPSPFQKFVASTWDGIKNIFGALFISSAHGAELAMENNDVRKMVYSELEKKSLEPYIIEDIQTFMEDNSEYSDVHMQVINKIASFVDPSDDSKFDTKVQYIIDTQSKKIIETVEKYYLDAIRGLYRINEETLGPIKDNSKFKEENDALNEMIDDPEFNINDIAKQRIIVEGTIADVVKKNELLTNFTQGLSAVGQIASGLCAILGKEHEANIISGSCSAGVQGAMIGSAFAGIGPLASLAPPVLGLMATATLIQFAGVLLAKRPSNPFIGVFQMLNSIFEQINSLRDFLHLNFDKLYSKLDSIERKLMKEILSNRNINLETLNKINSLSRDSIIQWSISNEGMSCADEKLSDIKTLIENIEAKSVFSRLGEFISTVFHNEDHGLYSSYRNQLVGHLTNPFSASHSAIIGTKTSVGPDMDPRLRLETILTICDIKILSNEQLNEYFKISNVLPHVYVGQIMNVSQFILSRPKGKHLVLDCNMFETYYNNYNTNVLYTVGIFIVEVEDSFVVLQFNKTTKMCTIYNIGIVPLYFKCKISKLIEYIDDYLYSEINIIHSDDTDNNNAKIVVIIKNIITNGSPKFVPSDLSDMKSMINKYYDIKTPTSHPLMYESLFKTLLFLMSKEYMPTTDDDRKMTRVSDNEINQLFNITQNIQQNFMKLSRLSDISHIKKLINDTQISKINFLDEFHSSFAVATKRHFERAYDEFVNTTMTRMSTVKDFDIDLDVSLNNPILGTGHEDYYNDRNGYSRNGVSGFRNGIWDDCVRQVRESAHSIMKQHIEYVNSVMDNMRSDKLPQYLSNVVVYWNKKSLFQLPFYMYPSHGSVAGSPILPLFKEIREMLINELFTDDRTC